MEIMETGAEYLMIKERSGFHFKDESGVSEFTFNENREHYDSVPSKKLIIINDEGSYVVFYNSLAQPRRQVVSLFLSEYSVEVSVGFKSFLYFRYLYLKRSLNMCVTYLECLCRFMYFKMVIFFDKLSKLKIMMIFVSESSH